jgi:hypothetical protein
MTARRIVLALLGLAILAFVVLHLAGAREDVGVLSGSKGDTLLGIAYAGLWFVVVLVVPIVGLTLLFELGWRRAERALRARRELPRA